MANAKSYKIIYRTIISLMNFRYSFKWFFGHSQEWSNERKKLQIWDVLGHSRREFIKSKTRQENSQTVVKSDKVHNFTLCKNRQMKYSSRKNFVDHQQCWRKLHKNKPFVKNQRKFEKAFTVMNYRILLRHPENHHAGLFPIIKCRWLLESFFCTRLSSDSLKNCRLQKKMKLHRMGVETLYCI